MTKLNNLIIPSQLLINSIEGLNLYQYDTEKDVQNITREIDHFIFICYEQHFPDYKNIVQQADYNIIISYTKQFMQFSQNTFFIDGEKINAYSLFLITKMLKTNIALKNEIIENYHIGIDISAEKDERKLWEKILSFCRKITKAEAGTLYQMSLDKRSIYFVSSQNEKHDSNEYEKIKIPYSKRSLVGYVCSTGLVLNINDAYNIINKPYSFNSDFDIKLHYRSKSILTVPMQTAHGETIGAVQLINKRNLSGDYISFTEYDEILLKSLASLAAVVIENNRLYEDISNLFDSVILSSTKAIEQRDPATKGHSVRVCAMTLALMQIIHNNNEIFDTISFSAYDFKAAEIASILHDFGKVGVRERILVKVNRLYDEDYERLKGRLLLIKLSLEKKELIEHSDHYQDDLNFITYFLDILDELNIPSPLNEEKKAVITKALSKSYEIEKEQIPLLTEREAEYLLIPRGNLTSQERLSMQNHVIFSGEIIRAMKWPYELRHVPEYILNHHEKLDGSGYPVGKHDNDIGMIERIISVVDIYDALTASDRSYKKAIPKPIAFKIIQEEVDAGKLDEQIFSLFTAHIEEIETAVEEQLKNFAAGSTKS